METINDIIINEFALCGYKTITDIEDHLFIYSTSGIDYWLISQKPDDFNKQKELFDRIIKQSVEMKFVEKNLSLLLLVNMDDATNESIDTIMIENEKSYFKKYVLKYNQESVSGVIHILKENKAKSIAELILEPQYFDQLRSDIGQLTPITLLYSIAHKLPFIPINASPIVRTDMDLNLSEDSANLLQWVIDAPNSNEEIENYIYDSINNEENEES